MFEYAGAAFILHATPPISQVQVHYERRKNGFFFDSISLFNFFFVCLWQIVPFLSITTTGPMGTKVEIYIRLQFEKKQTCLRLEPFFLLPHLLPAACFNLVPTFSTGVILYDG